MTSWMAWSALFTALIALAALGLERAAAQVGVARRFVWITAMIVAVVVPVVIATRVAPAVVSHTVLESPVVLNSAADAPTIRVVGEAIALEQPLRSWNWRALVAGADRWIGRAWLVASIVWSALLFGAVMRLRRRRTSWRDVETGAGRVLVSNDDGPAVVGFVHPRIVIPRWALVAEHETRELLLLHEREHLRAHDSRVLFGAAVLLALVPWNAALWWMSRRLRLAIEIDCDTRVIRLSGARHSYGHMLITIGERYVAPALPASAFLSEPGTLLEARIDAMTTLSARRPILAALPFVFASAFVLGAAAWTPLPAPFRAGSQTPMIAAPIAQPPVIVSTVVTTPIAQTPRLERPAIATPSITTVVAPDTLTPTVADPVPLRGNPAPRYPDSLRTLGVEGHVFMTFSTNAQGIPDTSTIHVIEATDELFTENVRRTLPRWRYDSPGRVRFAVYFRGPDSREYLPAPIIEGVSVMPVIVTASISVRRDTVQQETPARRQFDALFAAFNSADASRLEEFNKRYMRLDPVRDPTGAKGSAGLAQYRLESGGFDVLSIRRSQPTSLEFVARERAGSGATHVGYFAIVSADDPRIDSFRMLIVKPGQSVDDPALIEHLQNMRP